MVGVFGENFPGPHSREGSRGRIFLVKFSWFALKGGFQRTVFFKARFALTGGFRRRNSTSTFIGSSDILRENFLAC